MLSYHFVFFLFSVIFQLSKNSLFQKRGAKIVFFFFFSIFSVLSYLFENSFFWFAKTL